MEASVRRCKVLYFVQFMGYGSIAPFLPILYLQQGLSSEQIGTLASLSPVVSFVAAPILCAIADRFHLQRRILLLCVMLSSALQALVLITPYGCSTFLWQGFVCIAKSAAGSPVGSLVDVAVLKLVKDSSCGYGGQRLFGAIGFGLANLIAGFTLQFTGWGVLMSMYLLLCAWAFFLCLSLHHTSPVPPKPSIEENKFLAISPVESERSCSVPSFAEAVPSVHDTECGVTAGNEVSCERKDAELSWSSSLSHAVSKAGYDLPLLALIVVLSGFLSGVIDTFLFIRLFELGARGPCMGLARTLMCLAEVPVFYSSGRLLNRIGIRNAIVLAQAAYIVRFVSYVWITNPYSVLFVEPLHGLTYAILWASLIAYVNSIATPGTHTTLQGIASALHWGLGAGLGSIIGGVLYAHYGAVGTFKLGAYLGVLSTCLAILAAFLGRRESNLKSTHGDFSLVKTTEDMQAVEMVDVSKDVSSDKKQYLHTDTYLGSDSSTTDETF